MVRLEEDVVVSENKKEKKDFEELHSFAKGVIEKMKKENIAPTPYNFQIYFETSLDNQNQAFKKKVNILRQSEADVDSEEHHMQMEKDIKESFNVVKTMIQSISLIYKNINIVKGIIKKRNGQLKTSVNQASITNTITVLNNDMNKIDSLLDNQLRGLKSNYEKAVSSLRSVEKEAIFDTRYGLYNKKYFLNTIKKEIQVVKEHNHNSSLMLLKVKDVLTKTISSNKDKIALTKNVARLLQKTSKRSDIIAHVGDGIFAMLMKHTDINSAKLACERIANLIYDSSFFIGGEDIEINLEIVASCLSGEKSVEQNLANILKTMPKSSKDTQKFIILQS